MDMPEMSALSADASPEMKAHHAMMSAHRAMMVAHCKAMEDHGAKMDAHGKDLDDYAVKMDKHHEAMDKAMPHMEKLAGSLPSRDDVPPDTSHNIKTEAEGEALARASRVTTQLAALTGKTDPEEALGFVAGLKASAGNVATLTAKVKELEDANTDRMVIAEVDAAIVARKATPSERESLIMVGRTNIAALRGNLAARTALAGAQQVQVGTEGTDLDANLIAMAKQAGVSVEVLRKHSVKA